MLPYRAPPDAGAEAADRDRVGLAWRPRATPRAVTAVLAEGAPAAALLTRLLALSDEHRASLRGVADARRVLVLGAADRLPWVDGLRYLGRAPEAPTLTLPTAQDPTVPLGLLERALARRAAPVAGPFALWPTDEGTAACSLADARPLDRGLLLAALRDLLR